MHAHVIIINPPPAIFCVSVLLALIVPRHRLLSPNRLVSQEGIPALVADSIVNGDKKMSYYREHTHALASGVDAGRVMAELFAKDGGTCRGAGGSMHVYDKDTHFQVRGNLRSVFFFHGGRAGGAI